jgi:hypothetical protein
MDELDQVSKHTLHAFSSLSLPTQQIENLLLVSARSNPFYGKVGAVLAQCLTKDPMSRNLGSVIEPFHGTPFTWRP